ncbi:MAG: hypothetical protein B1H08_00225 [Candidatus Omnitrophica bacterium 4484_171]|nr:MAG: hypothetical protein B1H08_00225 [Candidatus Omnitrophica bacterium 4484_171]
MNTFVYKVRDSSGKPFTGVIEADNVKAAKAKLRVGGYYVVTVSPQHRKSKTNISGVRIRLDTLLMFTHQLSAMIESGLPILLGLDIIWKQMTDPVMQLIISQIKNSLNSGKSLSEAINEFPRVFPVMYRSLLSVAETGAGLAPILKKLVGYLTDQQQFVAKIKRAITYPLIVVVFAIIVVILMFTLVVPTFQKVFSKINVSLPLVTQIVVDISHLMRSVYFWIIAVALVSIAVFIYKTISSTYSGRLGIDRLKLKLPIFGRINYVASMGRFVRSLGLLLNSGLPVVKSLEVSKATVVNKYIEEAVDFVKVKITEGDSLSDAMEKAREFPTLLVEMVAVGEKSGTLSDMLDKVAVYLEEELDARLDKFLTYLEPILIIFVGGLVAFILVSIYLPIFSIWQGIHG